MVVNQKKVRRLMRQHGLQPRMRRRHVATTDSNHDQPIFANLTKDMKLEKPDKLWVADITYGAPRSERSEAHMFGMQRERRMINMPAACCEAA